jgi:tRNA U55 pseudouridine synthase TruB
MLLEYKESGITINQFIVKIKEKYPNNKIAYAGRLDPMARGYVPILFDEECYNMDKYTSMKKTYRVKVIVGIQTDTDDPLGIIQNINKDKQYNIDQFKLNNIHINQSFHYFSTKEINRRRKNKTGTCQHNVILYESSVLSTGTIPTNEFVDTIISTIDCIDKTKKYRQEEIKEQWSKITIPINYIELELKVSSGFFVRQFIRDMSTMNVPLMCYDIWRTELFIT